MNTTGENIDLRTVLRHSVPVEEATTGGDGESKLDALLKNRAPSQPQAPTPAPIDLLARFRARFAESFTTIIDELHLKYAPNGVELELDATDFLGGGRHFSITVQFSGHGMRLDATVTESVIAFSQTRFTASDRAGLAGSGPSLRTRDLTETDFRGFVCERIALLVQSALKRM